MLSATTGMRRAILGMAVSLLLAGPVGAAPLIVRSAGPSAKTYPAGKTLAEDAKLILKRGDAITLLDGRGTRTLSGPGTFSATASSVAAATTGSTLNALVSAGNSRRARVGAVRSASGIDQNAGSNPNMWYVDVSRSSNMCIVDPSKVAVWRPDATTAANFKASTADGSAATLTLAAGQSVASWPAGLPIVDGGRYVLSREGAQSATSLKFLLVKPTSTSAEHIAQSLIAAGCKAQLDLLMKMVAAPGSHSKS